MKALPAVISVLLVVASVAVVPLGVPGAGPTVQAEATGLAPAESTPFQQTSGDPDGTNQSVQVLDLPPGAANRTAIQGQHVDLGPALTFARDSTSDELETLTMVERVEAADGDEERQRRILGELNEVEQETISLKSKQSEALGAYSRGDLEPGDLLQTLASIDQEARSLEQRRERIVGLAQETPDFSIEESRLKSLERELDTFAGPVRSHAVAVLQGQTEPTRFYVAATPQSVVLSVVVGDAYVRETYREDRRNRSGRRIDPETAFDIAASSYPRVWETRQDTEVVGSGENFLVRVTFAGGDLAAFVDGGSRSVFKEYQRRPLSTMAFTDRRTAERDGLALTVNRTYAGGPMQLHLTDAETGDPVSANVTIGPEGEESVLVGRTDERGELWTLTPGSRYTVTAIRGNSVIFVTFSPNVPPRLDTPQNETSA